MMKDSLFLVKASDNWEDEIDVAGCFLVHSSVWSEFKEAMRQVFNHENLHIDLGTNQSIEYETHEEYFRRFTFRLIDTKTEAALQDLFGLRPLTVFRSDDGVTLVGPTFGESLLPPL